MQPRTPVQTFCWMLPARQEAMEADKPMSQALRSLTDIKPTQPHLQNSTLKDAAACQHEAPLATKMCSRLCTPFSMDKPCFLRSSIIVNFGRSAHWSYIAPTEAS